MRRLGAVVTAMVLAILPMQARAAQYLVAGSGSIGDVQWLSGQFISGPDGPTYASLAGLTSDDAYSFSLLVDSPGSVFGTSQIYHSTAFNFSLNGMTLLSNEIGGWATIQITHDLVDFFTVSIEAPGIKLFPSLSDYESSSYTLQYSLPTNTLSSTELSANPQFLAGFPTYINTFSSSHNGSGIEDRFGVSTLAITPLAVPEPATWLLMFAGLGLMGGALRVSRRASCQPRVAA